MIEYGKAICYSGYRKGQCPDGKMPSKEQIREDLEILLADGYRYLRMYDPNEHARRFKEAIDKPVTFCEGVLEWKSLQKLAELMDFISIHSYPLHYGNTIDEALEVNKKQYAEISALYPDKQVIFTELGWATKARDELKKSSSSEENQTRYIKEVTEWFEEDKIIGFIFEAFDESWKGEAEDSCECNWGLYYESRQPKPVIASLKSK